MELPMPTNFRIFVPTGVKNRNAGAASLVTVYRTNVLVRPRGTRSGGRSEEMAGRPTAFNTAVLRAIVREIRRGAFDWVAAEAAGIDRKTFYRWMKRGEQGEAPFAELKTQVDRARARTRIGAEHRVRDE